MITDSFILQRDGLFTLSDIIDDAKLAKIPYGGKKSLQKMLDTLVDQGLLQCDDEVYTVIDTMVDQSTIMTDNAFRYYFPSVLNTPSSYMNPLKDTLIPRVQPKRKCVQNALAYALELHQVARMQVSPSDIPECNTVFDGMNALLKQGLDGIVGYAGTRGVDYVKTAISSVGYVVMPFIVYANYQQHTNGDLPDPDGSEMIGYHAATFIGYDQDRFYFIASWRGFPVIGSISSRYVEIAAGTALFFYHDMWDVRQANTCIHVSSNVPTRYQIDDGDPLNPGVPIIVPRYTNHTIVAHSTSETQEMEISKDIHCSDYTMDVAFHFSPVKVSTGYITGREMVRFLNR